MPIAGSTQTQARCDFPCPRFSANGASLLFRRDDEDGGTRESAVAHHVFGFSLKRTVEKRRLGRTYKVRKEFSFSVVFRVFSCTHCATCSLLRLSSLSSREGQRRKEGRKQGTKTNNNNREKPNKRTYLKPRNKDTLRKKQQRRTHKDEYEEMQTVQRERE